METITPTSLRITRVIAAPRVQVFKAWTTPDLIKRWSCPVGMKVAESESDLTVGGRYRLVMRAEDGSPHTAHGTYVEVAVPAKLVYTWDWEETPMGETTVTVHFRDLGDSTEVTVEHTGFPVESATQDHEQGWSSCLDQLETLLLT